MASPVPNRGRNGKWCRRCGRHVSECGPLSARYRCAECGEGRMLANVRALIAHDGPEFDHWRRQCMLAFGLEVMDAIGDRE